MLFWTVCLTEWKAIKSILNWELSWQDRGTGAGGSQACWWRSTWGGGPADSISVEKKVKTHMGSINGKKTRGFKGQEIRKVSRKTKKKKRPRVVNKMFQFGWMVDSNFEDYTYFSHWKGVTLGVSYLEAVGESSLDYRSSKLLSHPALLEAGRQGVSSTIPTGENTWAWQLNLKNIGLSFTY